MGNIKIGPSFFVNELREYSDWRSAYVREAAQNCLDARGSSTCSFEVQESNGTTIVAFGNDGEPMTEDVLVEKLLALGESGKRFEGSVGGFGKAKTLLYLAHQSYTIRSGSLEVVGSGGEYEIQRDLPMLDGTRSTVVMAGDHTEAILQAVRRFIEFAQWDGVFVINREELRGDLRKGSPRRDLGFATVYSNRSFRYQMVVRINGIPMFAKGIGLDRCVVVELKGKSDEILTANRDGLLEPFGGDLSDFVTELAVDKRSALKVRSPKYVQYRGTKMCHVRQLNVLDVVEPVVDFAGFPVSAGAVSVPQAVESSSTHWSLAARALVAERVVGKSVRPVATLGTNFILKNDTDLKVPAYYDPGTGEFSEYSRKLVRIWGRLLVQLHRLFDVESEFSIGFVMDDESEAEFENGGYGRVYFLNPCKLVEQKSSYSKSFQKRFKLTERGRLIAIAAHEFVHGGYGLGWHDETYSSKFTDVMGYVLTNASKFAWCFK